MTGNSKPKNKMLKLIKNDFLASSRVISLFYTILVVALAVFFIGDKTDNNRMLYIGFGASFLVSFLLIFVSFFFVVNDFNKSLFTQQGYLSFSLPVTSNQLLGSKVLVYGFWMIISDVVFLFIVYFLYMYFQNKLMGESNMNLVTLALNLFGLPSKHQILTYALYFIFVFFVLILSFISMIYFAISASHMRAFQAHNIIWAVIIFVVLAVVCMWLVDFLDGKIPLNIIVSTENELSIKYNGSFAADGSVALSPIPVLTMIIEDVAMFFGTSYVMHKKINIK